MSESRPIVVGVDGSEGSLEALRQARHLAEVLGCPLQAVTVWQMPATATGFGWPLDYDFDAGARELLTEALHEAYGDELPADLDQVVVAGTPAQVLKDLSEQAHMIVVGIRGRGGFTGLLLGSVSSAVAAHARCPVLIARPHAD